MNDNPSRLSRLAAILTQLQTKRLLTAPELAAHFSVSVRTIYRDVRALERAGIPILTEEGKGYSIMEGYRVPPVMFTEREANAMVTAEQFVLQNKDASFVQAFAEAVGKIKAVLPPRTKENVNLLADRVLVYNSDHEQTTDHLAALQIALTNFTLVDLEYHSGETSEITKRTVEPFALCHTQGNWVLIAWCRLRRDYRSFRLDRIKELSALTVTFRPHGITLQQYFDGRRN